MKLVLLPGLDGTGELFSPFVAALPPSLEPVVVAYPRDKFLHYPELLTVARAALPPSEPYCVIGESFSGPLALMLAAEAPPNLQAVVLCASFATNPLGWFPAAFRGLVQPVLFIPVLRFLMSRTLAGFRAPRTLYSTLESAVSSVSPSILAARARAALAVNALPSLRSCSVPLLYLRASRDHVVSRRALRRLLRYQPTLQTVTISAPHLVLQAAPAQSVHAIEVFLAGQARGV